MVVQMTGTDSELVFKPLPQDDPLQRCPDISRANKELKWRPTTPLEEGIEKTIKYFRDLAAP